MKEGLLFEERRAMAQSQKNLWTRMVSTWKCVFVRLSPELLTVGLHGLMGALVAPFGPDLDHEIPLYRIRRVERRPRSVLGHGEVSVKFDLEEGERELLLYLCRADEFAGILESIRR